MRSSASAHLLELHTGLYSLANEVAATLPVHEFVDAIAGDLQFVANELFSDSTGVVSLKRMQLNHAATMALRKDKSYRATTSDVQLQDANKLILCVDR